MAILKPTAEGKGYKLFLGDCLEVMRGMEPGCVDAVVTDPPYGTTACSWDVIIPLGAMWEQLRRIVKPTGVIVLHASQPFTSALVMSNPSMFRYCWVWEKTQATGHLNANVMPMRAHEDIVVFGTKPPYFPQITHGHKRKVSLARHKENTGNNQSDCYGKSDSFGDYDSTSRYPRSVVLFSSDKQNLALHPTQKPIALMEYLVRTYARPGQVVLDFSMGSGTTGLAAKNCGCEFIGIEIDPKYFAIAERRIRAASEQGRLFEPEPVAPQVTASMF